MNIATCLDDLYTGAQDQLVVTVSTKSVSAMSTMPHHTQPATDAPDSTETVGRCVLRWHNTVNLPRQRGPFLAQKRHQDGSVSSQHWLRPAGSRDLPEDHDGAGDIPASHGQRNP